MVTSGGGAARGARVGAGPAGEGPRSASLLLSELQRRGAPALLAVRLRRNRTVLWSLTGGGRVLNLHAAYAEAPPELLDDLALLAGSRGRRGPHARTAARRVREWPPVGQALERARGAEVAAALAAAPGGQEPLAFGVRCAGTEGERSRIRGLYHRFNRERLEDLLPPGIPLRISGRMSRRLGHMRPARGPGGVRVVVEIALSRILLHPANGLLLEDVLLHEMAHAADWLVDGRAGHGPTWKAWARRVGCTPRACTDLPVRGGAVRGRRGSNRGRGRG